MKRLIFNISCLLVILFISSCGKTTCIDPSIRLIFRNFDSTKLSRVIIAQYKSDSTTFSSPVSVRVCDSSFKQTSQSNDTVYMAKVDTIGTYISPGYDYEITVPLAHKTYTITKISYTEKKLKTTKHSTGGCTNDISYYLDSMPNMEKGGSFTESAAPPVDVILNN